MAKIHEKLKAHIHVLLSKHKLIFYGKIFLVVAIIALIGLNYGDDLYQASQHLYYQFQKPKTITHHMSKMQTFQFSSDILKGAPRVVNVYLPEEYEKDPTAHFPTLYLLHGSPGSSQDWLINAHIQHTIDTMIDAGLLRPLIVVFPDGNGPKVKDSQYVNASQVDQDMGRHIAVEVVAQIDKRYRTLQTRHSRAIGGVSSGGYGAVNLTLHYPGQFGVVMSISGYFRNHEYVISKLFGSDLLSLVANNPLDHVKDVDLPKDTFFFLQIGDKENPDWLLEQNEMRDALVKQNTFAVVQVTKGGHGWNEWQQNTINALQFFDQHIQY